MSYNVNLQQRLHQLEQMRAALPGTLRQVQTKAVVRAVEAAADATPPKAGTGRGSHSGTNTLTGQLKAHWRRDSQIEPVNTGAGYVSVLANNMEYAPYVNDGHRMDRHFVPGLYIDPNTGQLAYDPAAKGGLVVGTKTRYVKGEFMVDKAKKVYQDTILKELDKEIERAMR